MADDRIKVDAQGESWVNAVGQIKAKTVNFGDRYESSAPRPSGVSGIGSNPPDFEDYWVDRVQPQEVFGDRLKQENVTEIVADGGFGKSALAAWAYDRFKGEFQRRVWVDLRWGPSFYRVAEYVLQEIDRPNQDPQATEETLLRDLLVRLRDPNFPVKTLVVMDNLESITTADDWPWFEQFLAGWQTEGRESRVLVTTRSPIGAGRAIALGGFSASEGTVFLERQGIAGEGFERLVELASGHPLLLKLAASWTRETYGGRLDGAAIDFFGKLFAQYQGDPTLRVEAIFGVIFGALPEGLRELLGRVSVYRVSFDLGMAQAMRSAVTIDDLETLANQGLLLAQDDRFGLHPLVERLVKAQVTEADRSLAHELAIAYYISHFQDWDGTISSCQAELEVFYHACELGQYGRARAALDSCYSLLNRAGYYRDLLPLYQRLVDEWQPAEVAEQRALGWTITTLGHLQDCVGLVRQAIEKHKLALTIFSELTFAQGQAASLANLGNMFYLLGQFHSAIDYHQKSLAIKCKIGNRSGEANSLGGLGLAYFSLGQYQRAIEFHQEHNDITKEIGDRGGEATSLSNLGNAYCLLGQYQQAIKYQQQALRIAREINDRSIEANSLGSLGIAYQSLGQYQQSINCYQQYNDISSDIGYLIGEAKSLSNLGSVYCDLGQYQKAIIFYQRSLNIDRGSVRNFV